MTSTHRTMDPPVELTEPRTEPPRAVKGCDVCAALLRQWRMATAPNGPAFDLSFASDLTVEISRHPHAERAGTP